MEIEGKAAVVSGGASGLGRVPVLALVERGAKAVVADVDEDGGHRTVNITGKKGGIAVFCRCDVTITEDLGCAFDLANERFGRLGSAFNNAGVSGEDLFADDPGDWKRVIDIDLTAVIDATRLAVREMRSAGRAGAI
jgi:15-hydroxyprostaglandin dehydrogenase (NAD)